jgi:8-oxo-dGTP pyrophosphatase MutT (NUDIX family)
MMMDLKSELEAYRPFNEQEEKDRDEILYRLEHEDIWTRQNRGAHLSASAWVLNRNHTKVLMCWHKIYRSWSWLGGHADGDHDLLHVAMKEVQEESGLHQVRPLDDHIFSVEILTVDGHIKNGAYVSSHLHLNVTYLLEADDSEPLTVKPDENTGVKWFTPEEALKASTEPWFISHVYTKLIAKTEQLLHEKRN